MGKQDWMGLGVDVGVGAVAGVADQLLQNLDDKRETDQGAKLPVYKQWSALLDFAMPVIGIGAVAMGAVSGNWATRVATMGSQLAGRKVTWEISKRNRVVAYTVYRAGDKNKPAGSPPAPPALSMNAGNSLDF